MYEVYDDYYANLLNLNKDKKVRKVRFLGGDIETLRKMTEEEWEKAKEKARQW